MFEHPVQNNPALCGHYTKSMPYLMATKRIKQLARNILKRGILASALDTSYDETFQTDSSQLNEGPVVFRRFEGITWPVPQEMKGRLEKNTACNGVKMESRGRETSFRDHLLQTVYFAQLWMAWGGICLWHLSFLPTALDMLFDLVLTLFRRFIFEGVQYPSCDDWSCKALF